MAGYGTDEGFAAYATAAGYNSLRVGANVPAGRQRGSLYVNGTFGARFFSVPTGGAAQERAWPRTGATDVYGNALDPATVPQRVIDAS